VPELAVVLKVKLNGLQTDSRIAPVPALAQIWLVVPDTLDTAPPLDG
jgi:hypothetical protein